MPVTRHASKSFKAFLLPSLFQGSTARRPEEVIIRVRKPQDGQYMCKSRTTPRDWFNCTRPEHPAHGGVMLCKVQCRPASACARKSPPRGCTLKKQDKTRQGTTFSMRLWLNQGQRLSRKEPTVLKWTEMSSSQPNPTRPFSQPNPSGKKQIPHKSFLYSLSSIHNPLPSLPPCPPSPASPSHQQLLMWFPFQMAFELLRARKLLATQATKSQLAFPFLRHHVQLTLLMLIQLLNTLPLIPTNTTIKRTTLTRGRLII